MTTERTIIRVPVDQDYIDGVIYNSNELEQNYWTPSNRLCGKTTADKGILQLTGLFLVCRLKFRLGVLRN